MTKVSFLFTFTFTLCLFALPAAAQVSPCPAYPTGAFQLQAAPATGIVRLADNAVIPRDMSNRDYACEREWEQTGNTPLPAPTPTAPQKAASDANTKFAAGVQIISTSNPALNATYALDPVSQQFISAAYNGIRGGDGLPGNGTTFAYADSTGAAHAFDATHFLTFAKAVRDYVYAVTQASRTEAAGGIPSWPTQPVTIP